MDLPILFSEQQTRVILVNNKREWFLLFVVGLEQILVTTDACSEGIDVPECNLVVSMDKIKTSRSLIHTRGRARSKGGKFVIMVEVCEC